MANKIERVPKHLGIIMDGNRRFAKRLMLKPWKGHEWGKEKVRKVIDWVEDLGIKEVTLYAFSLQNFNRPKIEFEYIMKLFKDALEELLHEPKIDKSQIRVNFIGRIHMFPKETYELMKKIMEKSRKYDKMIVNFAMAYGGREEVLDAVKKVSEKIKKGTLDVDKLNEEVFGKELYIDSCPDLIIRTGGERRTSNFLVWQSHYAEWIFLDKKWPEFEKQDLIECVQEYEKRQRRFGR